MWFIQEREEDYSRKHQKKDRNLPSNILKMLTGAIYSNVKLREYLERQGLDSEVDLSAIF